jgi:putative heme degradation protein
MNSLPSKFNYPWHTAKSIPSSSPQNYDIYDSEGKAILKVYLRGVSPREQKDTHELAQYIVDLLASSQTKLNKNEEAQKDDYRCSTEDRILRDKLQEWQQFPSIATESEHCEGACQQASSVQ